MRKIGYIDILGGRDRYWSDPSLKANDHEGINLFHAPEKSKEVEFVFLHANDIKYFCMKKTNSHELMSMNKGDFQESLQIYEERFRSVSGLNPSGIASKITQLFSALSSYSGPIRYYSGGRVEDIVEGINEVPPFKEFRDTGNCRNPLPSKCGPDGLLAWLKIEIEFIEHPEDHSSKAIYERSILSLTRLILDLRYSMLAPADPDGPTADQPSMREAPGVDPWLEGRLRHLADDPSLAPDLERLWSGLRSEFVEIQKPVGLEWFQAWVRKADYGALPGLEDFPQGWTAARQAGRPQA